MKFPVLHPKSVTLLHIALVCVALSDFSLLHAASQTTVPGTVTPPPTVIDVGPGWARNSVNAPIFRRNSIISDAHWQFTAYYDAEGRVVLARRRLDSERWELHTTAFQGNVNDAHNSISLALDGDGYLHLSWDHHNTPLRYTRSLEPYGFDFPSQSLPMIARNEQIVSYPEFYRFSNGDLLFAYREGGSGNGNLVLNRYDVDTASWQRLQSLLIDGEGVRNAYWQLCLDAQDRIHLSWVWRETPNVASNHDLSYAVSPDGGLSWQRSNGSAYDLPIRLSNAEVIHPIPQGSNLINQTSMSTDSSGNPYIATYYREHPDAVTQFHLIYQHKGAWHHSTATQRTLDFELEGIGSRSIPISRPQLLLWQPHANTTRIALLYRDESFANAVCLTQADLPELQWTTQLLHDKNMGRWEPSFDPFRWQYHHELHLFLQAVGQGQAETLETLPPQMVRVLEWTP